MARASIGSAAHLTSLPPITRLLSTPPFPFTTSRSAVPVTTCTAMSSADGLSGHHPSLEVLGGARDKLLPAFNNLDRPYTPFPLIGWNCHVETIFVAFYRSLPEVRLRRECVRTKDDGSVALDWVCGDDLSLPSHSPVLILLVILSPFLFLLYMFIFNYLRVVHTVHRQKHISTCTLSIGPVYICGEVWRGANWADMYLTLSSYTMIINQFT